MLGYQILILNKWLTCNKKRASLRSPFFIAGIYKILFDLIIYRV